MSPHIPILARITNSFTINLTKKPLSNEDGWVSNHWNRVNFFLLPLLPGMFESLSKFEDSPSVNELKDKPMMTTTSQSTGMGMMRCMGMKEDEMDCCTNNLGTMTATTTTTELGEIATGLPSLGVVTIACSGIDDCGEVTITYQLSGTTQYGSDYTTSSAPSPHTDTNGNLLYYEGTLTLFSGYPSYHITLIFLYHFQQLGSQDFRINCRRSRCRDFGRSELPQDRFINDVCHPRFHQEFFPLPRLRFHDYSRKRIC